MKKKISVLVVDDHGIVRAGIKSTLSKSTAVNVVGEATNGLTAIEKMKATEPDVIVLDLSIPDPDGLDVLKFVKKEYPATKAVVFTMHEDPEYLSSAIEHGAEGYLLKSSDLAEIEKAVITVYSGKHFYSEQLSGLMASAIKMKKQEPTLSIYSVSLSGREKEVLEKIIEGLSNKMISDKLSISTKTVAVHRTNIMKKVQAKNTADLVRIAITNKLV